MDTKFIFIFLYHLLSLILIYQLPFINGFGFDSPSPSCSQKISRRGRAQLLKSIPCDLTQQTYCNLPGSSYPWHAVRRFVHENQGLMKRMYGDVHQISVLRNEIQNNEVDIDELQIRESSHFSSLSNGGNIRGHKMGKYLNTEYQNSRANNNNNNNNNNDILIEPHFRPASTSTSTTTTTSPTTTTSVTTTTTTTPSSTTTTTDSNPTKSDKPLPAILSNSKKELIKESKQHESLDDINMDEDDDDDNNYSPDNNLESNSVYETGSTQNPFNHQNNNNNHNIKIIKAPIFNQQQLIISNKNESATIPTTLRVVVQQQIVKTEIESPPSTKSKSKSSSDQNDLTQKINENIRNVNESLGKKQLFIDQTTSSSISYQNHNRTIVITESTEEQLKEINNGGNDKKKYSINRPSINNNQNTMMEGQLFQDTVNKEIPSTNFRGVNACPVKEEVVAPFWANNTRGEVLALLNLYPFEQYVHWERCTNEHKQMYCRDGCRCEQQYSLHRLLAYDPRDECRGIFSDWFRFPSCCVCKCYNIPLEFRATSRSPRSDNDLDIRQHPIDLAEANVHRAIYEHATEDWYRPKDHYDDYLD